MYIPEHFNVTDKEEILAFIKANAFGQLISLVEGKLFSSHIPFFLSDDNQSLICHIAKRNPQWENIEDQEALVTFQGPHDYVSPSWYSSSGVPTWNYQSVHIYGRPQLITETEQLSTIVNELTGIYESSLEKPWEPEYKESMLNAIIGIKIKITDIQCKYKLSQNRSANDRLQVIEEHKKRGSSKLSSATKNAL
ncbi:FMN-binding negative transcriptional regulator [Sulfuriflexus mobilis]|uniref:FMN-binding negative transcriptional regulator n=1 Tax=Sulfuriflexus mobilis TaxID=1811807 RepID=UPI000F83C9EC|nr:FMN-binding negative transcriptional regulator [Sulfuriflexus mobilis]